MMTDQCSRHCTPGDLSWLETIGLLVVVAAPILIVTGIAKAYLGAEAVGDVCRAVLGVVVFWWLYTVICHARRHCP